MKNILLIPIVAALLCLPACTTTPTGQRVPDVLQMQTVAKSAAFLGTTIYLNGLPPGIPGHPQDRPQFELARTSLRTLIAAGSFSASAGLGSWNWRSCRSLGGTRTAGMHGDPG